MNKKVFQTAAFVAFISAALVALYYGGVFGNTSDSETTANREAQDVQILKYSDYSCPACKAYVALEEQLEQEYGEKIEIEYRYFPLESFPHSQLAAYAVEAANQQDKWQEMHDIIFEHQEDWSRSPNGGEMIMGYAEQIGLDMEQFREDLDSEEVANTVQSQKREGIRRTVQATPTYFLNGQKLRQNPQSYEQFKAIVELYMYRSNG